MVGSKIVSSQNAMKRNEGIKTVVEMCTHDKNIMMGFLMQRKNILFEKAKSKLTPNKYHELLSVHIIYIQCSNGKRPGETDRTLLSDYMNRKKQDDKNEFFQMMEIVEQQRA